jgi:DNA helicase-2/ATP-dependent DNA helicase PcrA
VVYEAPTRNDEAKFVLNKIQEYVKEKKYDYRDFFIIYRINAWSQEFEFEFENHHIPYQLVGGFKFRERKVIKDAIAYLRSVSLQDNLAIERVLKETPKVGVVTVEKLRHYALEKQMTLFEVLTGREELILAISKNLLEIRHLLIEGHQLFLKENSVYDLLEFMLKKSGYQNRLEILAKDEEDQQNLKILFDQLKTFDEVFAENNFDEPNHTLAFLQEESLGAEEEDNQTANRVTLLTAHAAKGLENKVVFLVGVNKGIFPSKKSLFSPKLMEEERRTFYVGMTRAEEELFISYVNGE